MYAMSSNEILSLAEKYLIAKKIEYVIPGKLGKYIGDQVEVIFLHPEALNPDVVVDPPDTRVLVNTKTKEVNLVWQM